MKTVPTVDLYALVRDKVERLGTVDLRHGALDGVFFHRLQRGLGGVVVVPREVRQPRIDHSGNAVAHRFRGEQANRHLGNLVLHEAEL